MEQGKITKSLVNKNLLRFLCTAGKSNGIHTYTRDKSLLKFLLAAGKNNGVNRRQECA